jgi:hypothetical protein
MVLGFSFFGFFASRFPRCLPFGMVLSQIGFRSVIVANGSVKTTTACGESALAPKKFRNLKVPQPAFR